MNVLNNICGISIPLKIFKNYRSISINGLPKGLKIEKRLEIWINIQK